jgi:Protein of unknown function (DUF2726)
MKLNVLITLIVLLGVLITALLWRLRSSNAGTGKDSYEPAMMLDVTEQRVLRHLLATFPDRFVMAKVPIATVIQVDRSRDRKRAKDRMEGLLAQFAVCGSEGLAQIVFEMETPATRKSINFEKQLKRKYALLKNAGVPMVRIKSSDIPAPGEFRKQLDFAVAQRLPSSQFRPTIPNETGNMSMPMGVTTVMNGPSTPLTADAKPGAELQEAGDLRELASSMSVTETEGQRTLH